MPATRASTGTPSSLGLHILTVVRRGWPGPLAILSLILSPRSPDTLGDGIREEADTLALAAEPAFLESEAGEKWKRPFR